MIAGAWSGHIGTSFSSLEIMSWLFLNEMRDLDKGPEACDIFFSSKGHDAPALYAVLIGLGLLPPKTSCTSCAVCTACPATRTSRRRTSRPTPARSAWASRRRRAWRSPTGSPVTSAAVFVLTGDGELQEGQFWESLGIGRQSRRSARSSPSSITTRSSRTPGCTTSATSAISRRSSARSAGTSRAATATTSRRSSARSARSTTVDEPAEGHHRRHREGQGRVLHGRARR